MRSLPAGFGISPGLGLGLGGGRRAPAAGRGGGVFGARRDDRHRLGALAMDPWARRLDLARILSRSFSVRCSMPMNAPRRREAWISSSSLACIAALSRFWVFWIRNTIRKVTIVVPVLITSCQVSQNLNTGPVAAQPSTMARQAMKVQGWPASLAVGGGEPNELLFHRASTAGHEEGCRPASTGGRRSRVLPHRRGPATGCGRRPICRR